MTTIHAVTWQDRNGTEQRAYCADRDAVVRLLGERVLDGGVRDPEVVEHELLGARAATPPAPAWLHVRPEDAELERRRQAVIDAATNLLGYHPDAVAPRAVGDVQAAVETLREYVPAEVVDPAAEGEQRLAELRAALGPDRAPAPAGARERLHELAPLPWSTKYRSLLDARGYYAGEVAVGEDAERVAELLVQLVNAEPAALPPAVQAVLDAARDAAPVVQRTTGGHTAVTRLCAAVDALSSGEVTDKGVSAT